MGLLDRIFAAIGLGKQRDTTTDETTDAGQGGEQPEPEPEPEPAAEQGEPDPELEAQDDCGSFDFERDITRFFTAEFRIEQAWANPERREQLFAEYQVRDAAHWHQIEATFERWLASPVGKAKYPTEAALTQARMSTTQAVTLDELNLAIEDARRAKSG